MRRSGQGRFHWTVKPDYAAECEDCDFELYSRNALGTAARHHDATGHTVRVGVESAVYYETRERYDRRMAAHAAGYPRPGAPATGREE